MQSYLRCLIILPKPHRPPSIKLYEKIVQRWFGYSENFCGGLWCSFSTLWDLMKEIFSAQAIETTIKATNIYYGGGVYCEYHVAF